MRDYFKLRLQGQQWHVYVTVDGVCIAHRVLHIGRGRLSAYIQGIYALGIPRNFEA